ncbi:hypothetical protein LCI18_002719 [Fusarium solani-melongenae]|uniref:Uncharacterized protein n=1 Tax=Fusarium solani subsp. cucurbitae TaxID=2747967 RepID=A0ACD3YS44_FUSSC|nr:hypothetical protein LCI18_002719 [Fusarium solani-melongenae]
MNAKDTKVMERGEDVEKTSLHEVNADHGAETQLQRQLGSRHLTMIALGSSIGMGFWLGSGAALSKGGPASLLLGFFLAATIVWSVCHAMGEMAVMYPLPSAFVQWSSIFVSPAAGLALGWAYWLQYCITMGNELQICSIILGFWTDKIPKVAIIIMFLVFIIAVNIFAVKVFGEVEVVASTIKFLYIFVIIISMIVISAGAAPKGEPIGFRYWNKEAFIGGFKGFLAVLPTCVFSMSGSENSGLVACEVHNPQKSVPKSVGSIWLRLSAFYLLGTVAVSISTDPQNPDLFGNGGTNASPFVIAFRNSGLSPLAHITNAIILISVLSNGSITIYSSSRTLVGLSHLGMAPKQLQWADSMGRPWVAIIPSVILGGGLAFLTLDNGGTEVFNWLSNLVSLLSLFGWGMICLTNIRMRAAWTAQGRTFDNLPWKSWTAPYGAWWGLFWCIVLIIVEFYLAVWPYHDKTSAKNFFATFVCVPTVLVIYLGGQAFYRTAWVTDKNAVDLDGSRRFYSEYNFEETKPRGKIAKAVKFLFD